MFADEPLRRRTVLAALAAVGLLGTGSLGACAGTQLDLAAADVGRLPAEPAVEPVVLGALAEFSGVILDRLAGAGPEKNVVCSPLSMWLALAMTRNGARGTTAAEMDTALRFPALDQLNEGLNTLGQLLRTRTRTVEVDGEKREIVLDLANQVFGERSVVWQEEFLTALARFYGTGVARADFAGDPAGERRRINDWVEAVTHDKIVDLVPAQLITPSTRMVLVNALYLRAPWATPFGDPSPGDFGPPDDRRPVPRMTASYTGRAAVGTGWRAVEIPYLAAELAMTVLLPDVGAEDAVRDRLSAGLIQTVLAALEPDRSVTVTLPTFGFRTQARLRPLLESLGMRAAFSDADFSAMTAQADLVVEDVVHQGWIAVDQHGTEAAAATAVGMREVSAPAPDRAFTLVVDRPFWFVITDVVTAAPLLVGRVVDPTIG